MNLLSSIIDATTVPAFSSPSPLLFGSRTETLLPLMSAKIALGGDSWEALISTLPIGGKAEKNIRREQENHKENEAEKLNASLSITQSGKRRLELIQDVRYKEGSFTAKTSYLSR